MRSRPLESLPRSIGRCILRAASAQTGPSRISRTVTELAFSFGISTPTTPLPGIGASMRMLVARSFISMVFAIAAICSGRMPGAGRSSKMVTTGPRATSVTSTLSLNSRSVSTRIFSFSSMLP